MNLQIRNKKQVMFFFITFAFVIGFLAIILFFNFSNKGVNPTSDNTNVEQISSSTSSTTTTEQVPERITDLLSSLPYQSSDFDVFYSDKKLKVYSRTLVGDTLKNAFLTWIARIPNFAVSKYTIEYYDANYMMDLKIKAQGSSNSQLTK